MRKFQQGLTLIELLVAIGILMILFALSTINLTRLPSSTSQSSDYDLLINDLRIQQNMAMAGYNNASGAALGNAHGVHFESASYTLFAGDIYSNSDPSNFVVELDPNLNFVVDLSAGANNSIVFMPGSGDISNYDPNHDTISLVNSYTNETKQVKLNKYGGTE